MCDFEVFCIIKEFDNFFWEKGVYGLLEEYLGKKFGLRSYVIREKLCNKRIFFVFDDVYKLLGVMIFFGLFDLISFGSLIIIIF